MAFLRVVRDFSDKKYKQIYNEIFGIRIKKFLQEYYPDNNFVANLTIWSFYKNEILLPFPIFINHKEDKAFYLSRQIDEFSFAKFFIDKKIYKTIVFYKKDNVYYSSFLNDSSNIINIDTSFGVFLSQLNIPEKYYSLALNTFRIAIKGILNNEAIKFIYFIPIVTYTDKPVSGILALNSSIELTFSFIENIFSPVITGIVTPYQLQELSFLQMQHATKSAIAAIMSRNMSHNLGSHVLSYASVNLNHPFDIQVLLEYMQERMDFIAQITSEPPQWSMPMHFVGQLMRNFYKQRILLNYIVESEGLKAKEYKLDKSDKNRLQIIVLDKYGNEIVPNEDKENTFTDPLVAMPGGITGAHAFYTILENVIRNSAKHSYKKSKDNDDGLKIYVQINDSKDECVTTVTVFDNVTKNIEKADKSGNKVFLLEDITRRISQSVINEAGSLRYENWGIAEIKIGAGFLQKKEQYKIGSKIEDLSNSFINLIALKKANGKYEIDENPKENSLIGYQFSIAKPKYVLIIDNLLTTEDISGEGIYFKKTITEKDTFDYEFVVIKNLKSDEFQKIKNKLPRRVFTCLNSDEDKDLTYEDKDYIIVDKYKLEYLNKILESFIINNKSNHSKIKEYLYKLWIRKLLKDKKNICLEVSPFEKAIGGSSISNLKAYKYSVETLLKSLSEDSNAYGIFKDFLNKENPNGIQDLFKELINKDKQMIPKLIDNKSSVVNFFKKYEEDIETLPEYFKEAKENSPEDYKRYYFDGDSFIDVNSLDKEKKDNKDNDCNNAIVKIKYKRHASGKTAGEHYVEAMSGSQSYFTEIENFVKNKAENVFAYSLIETGLLGLTVVDERVYEFYNSNPEIAKKFDAVNVFVTDKLDDLKNIDKKPVKDILIVHQGIIDKQGENILKNLDEKIYPYRYITSGSGDKKNKPNDTDKPKGQENEKDDIFKDFKFIPFSNVRSALMRQYPEKYILIQSLMKI